MTDKPLKLPSDLGECADLLYKTRETRLQMQKEVDKYAAVEHALHEHFVNTISKKQSGVAGRLARVQLQTKVVPVVDDWDKVYEYIRRNRAFDLLQRRINGTAVTERREAGRPVPGTGTFNAITVSCTLLKGGK